MDSRTDIGKKVEKTLDSLDGIKRAEPQAFFYTRLRARLERDEKNAWEVAGSFLARPVVAIVGLCMILVFNVAILMQKEMATTNTTTTLTDINQDDENIFASVTTYDYENLEP
jgi:hypothetical protein